ncbi:MAG: YbhN family protein [Rubrobacteraceae bacterium]
MPGAPAGNVLWGSPVRAFLFLLLSLSLGFGGLYLVAGAELFRAETYRIENPAPGLLIVCAAAFLAEWLMPAVRLQLLCRNQGSGVSYPTALLVHLVSVFGAVITPGNAGSAPAGVVALNRAGLPFGRGVGVMLQVFILDLFFFAWAVPLSLAYLLSSNAVPLPAGVEAVGLGMSVLALGGAVALGRYPRPVVALLMAVSRWPGIRRFGAGTRGIARDYYRSSRAYGRTPVLLRAALNVVTAVHWLAVFVLLWGFLQIYGVDLSLLVTLALLNILTLVSQFVPTPGGAGFVEAAVGLGVGSYATTGSVAGALLLWRVLAFNIIFLIGPFAGWLLYLRAGGGARKREQRKRPGRRWGGRT